MIEHGYQHHPMIPEGGRRCVVVADDGPVTLHCNRLSEEHYEETLAPDEGSNPCDRHSCRHAHEDHAPARASGEWAPRLACMVEGCRCSDYITAPDDL